MKTLANLGLALIGAGLFGLALVALGVVCVLGVGMAAAACDFGLTNDVAINIQRVEAGDLESSHSWLASVDPDRSQSAADLAYALDFDSPTAEPLPPGSVPVL